MQAMIVIIVSSAAGSAAATTKVRLYEKQFNNRIKKNIKENRPGILNTDLLEAFYLRLYFR